MWTLSGRPVNGCYEIIYADPAWRYTDRFIPTGAEAQYETTDLQGLCKLPVHELAAEHSCLFMWATWPLLFDALTLMTCWGFNYKNCAFDWIKVNKVKPTPFIGLGHWTRGNSEICLLGVRGKPKRLDAAVRQIVEEDERLVCAKLGRHSAKPPVIRDRILQLLGDRPAIELFAREKVPGWDCWGNEVPPETSVQLKAPEVPNG